MIIELFYHDGKHEVIAVKSMELGEMAINFVRPDNVKESIDSSLLAVISVQYV